MALFASKVLLLLSFWGTILATPAISKGPHDDLESSNSPVDLPMILSHSALRHELLFPRVVNNLPEAQRLEGKEFAHRNPEEASSTSSSTAKHLTPRAVGNLHGPSSSAVRRSARGDVGNLPGASSSAARSSIPSAAGKLYDPSGSASVTRRSMPSAVETLYGFSKGEDNEIFHHYLDEAKTPPSSDSFRSHHLPNPRRNTRDLPLFVEDHIVQYYSDENPSTNSNFLNTRNLRAVALNQGRGSLFPSPTEHNPGKGSIGSPTLLRALTQSNPVHPPPPPTLAVLKRVLVACRGVLVFFNNHISQMNLDAVFGTRIAEAQLKHALKEVRGGGDDGRSVGGAWWWCWKDVVDEMEELSKMAASVSQAGIAWVSRADPKYYNALGELVRPGFWDVKLRPLCQSLRQINNTASTTARVLRGEEQIQEGESDKCVGEVLGSLCEPEEEARALCGRCQISQGCWQLMTTPGYSSYSLTHQVFYLIIGVQAGCETSLRWLSEGVAVGQVGGAAQEESGLDGGIADSIGDLVNDLCSHVLAEAVIIDQAGYPEGHRDLFMEQGALCGLLGYGEFFRADWLERVLSWQRDSGCYGHTPVPNHPLLSRPHARVRREERWMSQGCLAHKTSVAISYLSVATRYMAQHLQ